MPRTTKTLKKTNKTRFSQHNSLNKYFVIGLFVVLFASVGSWLLFRSMAISEFGVPNGAGVLVASLEDAHEHEYSTEHLQAFAPPPFVLYGDGTLICGEHINNPKSTFELKSGKLSAQEIDAFIARMRKAGFNDSDVKAKTAELSERVPIELLDKITVNFNGGAAEVRGYSQEPSAKFGIIKGILTSTCASKAKNNFDASQYSISSQEVPASSEAAKALDDITPDAIDVSDDGQYTSQVVSKTDAETIIISNKGNTSAKLAKNGKTYEVMITPLIPTYKEVQIAHKTKPGHAEAASDMRTAWVWFYASDQPLSTLNTKLSTIATSAVAFYKQETGRTNTINSYRVVKGLQTAAWYKTCHWAGCTSSGTDSLLFSNIIQELKDRGYTYANISNNVLSQVSLSKNCTGLGTQPSSVTSSTGGYEISLGYGSLTSGCQNTQLYSGTRAYFVPAHEMGHTLGLAHTCSASNELMLGGACTVGQGLYTWPSGYTVTTAQDADLAKNSMFLNHKVSGKVYYSGTNVPVANMRMNTCRTDIPYITTNTAGYYEMRVPTSGAYCLRMDSVPSGYKSTTKNNPEHATAATYEYQLAGNNCYHAVVSTLCTTSRINWDMASDANKDFILVAL